MLSEKINTQRIFSLTYWHHRRFILLIFTYQYFLLVCRIVVQKYQQYFYSLAIVPCIRTTQKTNARRKTHIRLT